VDGVGLLPAAMSTRIGAQTQRPPAIVVIGGAIAAMNHLRKVLARIAKAAEKT